MRAIIQRVKKAAIEVDNQEIANIKDGLLVLVGFEENETREDYKWIAKKLNQLRIFNDTNSIMNLSVQDIKGEVLVVSQFTLFANCKKGNRPSYIRAAKPSIALAYYKNFLKVLELNSSCKIAKGSFGADMKVSLVNDGPITIFLDSKQKDI